MRKLTLAAIGVFMVFGLLAGPVLAQDEDGAPGKQMRGRRGHRRGLGDPKARLEGLAKKLNLTEEQQGQFAQAMKTHHQAMRNWFNEHSEELKAAREAMKKAHESKDKEAIKAAREKMAKIFESRKALNEDLFKQLGDFLTKEQLAKVKGALGPRRRRRPGAMILGALRRLDLNEQQKAQVKKILKEAKAKAKNAKGPEGRIRALKEAMEKIKKNVLTEEQAGKLAKMQKRFRRGRRGGPLANMELSDDQKAKIKAIMADARKKAQDAEGKDKRAIMREAFKKIHDEVLTDDQRTKADKMRKGFRMRRRRGRHHGRQGRGDGDGAGED